MLRNDMIEILQRHGVERGQEIIEQMIRRENKTIRIYSERKLDEAIEIVVSQCTKGV